MPLLMTAKEITSGVNIAENPLDVQILKFINALSLNVGAVMSISVLSLKKTTILILLV